MVVDIADQSVHRVLLDRWFDDFDDYPNYIS